MKRTALFLMAILFLCSCAGNRAARIQEKMKTWEGKHFNDLVAALGPPARVMDDGQGGKIFIYSASRKTYSPGFSWTSSRGQVNRQGDIYMSSKGWIPGNTYATSGHANTFTTPGYSYTRTEHALYWINQEGYIYRTAYVRPGSKGLKNLETSKEK